MKEDAIATLCEELKAAREAKRALRQQMEAIEETIAQLQNDVISAMKENDLQQCVTGGYAYTVKQTYRVEKQCDSKELVHLFRLNDHSDLVTEYVNEQKLSSFVAKELEANDELPPWLLGSVIVKATQKLSIRKSNI
ncbi:MAG: hypothetical protein K6F56_02115 [Oscillospiraceae bacterium]|nr:hypothetical protein [Oscillospiraceae bacterium]